MRFLSEFAGNGLEAELVIEHKGETVGWSVKNYRYFKPSDETILDINNYWSRLPAADQDKIFEIYRGIRNVFFELIDPRQIDTTVRMMVKELYDLMPREAAEKYISLHSNIWYPDTMKEEADVYNGEAENLTYSPKDYKDLAVLTMMLKPILPIVGQYVMTVSPMIEENKREGLAIQLMSLSNLVEYPAIERLNAYCHFFYSGDGKEMAGSAILGGLASSHVDEWLMVQVIYKQLVAGKLSQRGLSDEPIYHVKKLFSHVKPLTDDLGRYAGFGERIAEKTLTKNVSSGKGGDDDKTSVAENYKTKQEINETQITLHEVRSYDLEHLISRLDDTLPREYVDDSLAKLKEIDFSCNPLHKIICQYVLSPVVSPNAVYYVDYKAMMNYVAVTQALLHHWGFKHLAILMSSQMVKVQVRLLPQTKTAMSVEQLDKLDKYYPHFQSQITIRSPSRVKRNFVAADIENLQKDYGSKYWMLTVPAYVQNSVRFEPNSTINTPFDFEFELARLIIFLNERKLPDHVYDVTLG